VHPQLGGPQWLGAVCDLADYIATPQPVGYPFHSVPPGWHAVRPGGRIQWFTEAGFGQPGVRPRHLCDERQAPSTLNSIVALLLTFPLETIFQTAVTPLIATSQRGNGWLAGYDMLMSEPPITWVLLPQMLTHETAYHPEYLAANSGGGADGCAAPFFGIFDRWHYFMDVPNTTTIIGWPIGMQALRWDVLRFAWVGSDQWVVHVGI
jgi:hypothetical protein